MHTDTVERCLLSVYDCLVVILSLLQNVPL